MYVCLVLWNFKPAKLPSIFFRVYCNFTVWVCFVSIGHLRAIGMSTKYIPPPKVSQSFVRFYQSVYTCLHNVFLINEERIIIMHCIENH